MDKAENGLSDAQQQYPTTCGPRCNNGVIFSCPYSYYPPDIQIRNIETSSIDRISCPTSNPLAYYMLEVNAVVTRLFTSTKLSRKMFYNDIEFSRLDGNSYSTNTDAANAHNSPLGYGALRGIQTNTSSYKVLGSSIQ